MDSTRRSTPPAHGRAVLIAGGLIMVHVALLAFGAWRHSPTYDEAGHLPSGLYHWRTGRFELFRVNPPLVRMLAALPVIPLCPDVDWPEVQAGGTARAEWDFGRALLETARPTRTQWLFAVARWACLPFSLLGAAVCFLWARELFGAEAGVLATFLWCFSPTILANAQMITTDVPAASLGAAAAYAFWHWLRCPIWRRAALCGLLLGLSELTKMTWLILFVLWPLIWAVWGFYVPPQFRKGYRFSTTPQLISILTIGLYLINLGYGFDGSGRRLGDYHFISRSLAGTDFKPSYGRGSGGNRFEETALGEIPVPLPQEYVQGFDRQKWEFDRKRYSFLRGEWRDRGWWYYYFYAMAVKMPLGFWLLAATAAWLSWKGRAYRASGAAELFLWFAPAVILLLVSSQTGFNKHLRYLLPAFPFLFVGVSRVARSLRLSPRRFAVVSVFAAAWYAASSLSTFPHSMTYFNEIVGGPTNGHWHLDGSNLCVGQDLYYLREWLEAHPEAQPLDLALAIFFDPRTLGIEYTAAPPPGPHSPESPGAAPYGPLPGWYALDLRQINGESGTYRYFFEFQPVARAGYSIGVYHITPDEANRVRRKLGLSPVSEQVP